MQDLIDRQAAIEWCLEGLNNMPSAQPEITLESAIDYLHSIGWMQERDRILTESAQPELPSYVAEIEEEYQKAVKSPYIHKPLAKALYEVWKKHDRDDAERRVTDGGLD